jgi:stage II sporulation protein GA (sporulation sigma-E factor processing peptidase)
VEQTVYGDILFFVNFCMDFQCLFLTARLLHRPFRIWRAALASVLGALYACAALFLAVAGVGAFLLDSGVCLLMCALTFGLWGRPRVWLLPFGVYFGVSAAVGGVMSAMGSLLLRVEIPIGEGGRSLSSVAFFLLAALGGMLTLLWGRVCARRAKGKRALLTVTAFERTCRLSCMVDTGNRLRDPIGGAPVALVDLRAAKNFLPEVILHAAEQGSGSALGDLPTALAARIRLIPGETATGRGVLLAVVPTAALLDMGEGNVPVTLLLAPVPLRMSDEECAVLLPAELIAQ